jgi:chromosome segregation protein
LPKRNRWPAVPADELSQALSQALDRSHKLRAAQFDAEKALEHARTDREKRRSEVVSLEALQKAALQRGDSRTSEWLDSSGLGKQPRLAAQLSVKGGWERAVETALGDYLEALCVDELDDVAGVLPSLPVGRVSLLQAGGHMEADGSVGMLSGVVSGPSAIVRLLSRVRLAETLSAALQLRRELADDESVITATGRVDRAGLAARQSRWRSSFRRARARTARQAAARRTRDQRRQCPRFGTRLAACREELANAERERDQAQSRIQGRIASMPTCSASSKASAPVRRNPRCAVSASKKRRRKSRANSGLGPGHAGARGAELDRGLEALRRARFASGGTRRRTRGTPRSRAGRARQVPGRAARLPRPADSHRVAQVQRNLHVRRPQAHGGPVRADAGALRRTRSGAR